MPNLNDLSVLPLPAGPALNADESESRLSLTLEGEALIRLRLERGDELQVHLQEASTVPAPRALWAACYWLFAREPARQHLNWHLSMPLTMPCAADYYWPRQRRASFAANARCSGNCRNPGSGSPSLVLIRNR